MAVDIYRIVNGRIVEGWSLSDRSLLLKQLGLIEYTEKGKKFFQKMPSNYLRQHFSNPHAYRVVAEHCRIFPINSTFQFFSIHHNHVGLSHCSKNEDSSQMS